MCGGSSGPTAQQIYEGYKKPDKLSRDGTVLREGERVAGIKPTFGALPSLSMTRKTEGRTGSSYGDVRTGSKRRSLLAPMMQMAADKGTM